MVGRRSRRRAARRSRSGGAVYGAGMSRDLAGASRAAALLGYPVGGTDPGPEELRRAAGLLHDLIVWGLDRSVPDDALRAAEARPGRTAAELAQPAPAPGGLID